MGKLHELLAVEGDLKASATRTANDVKAVFDKTVPLIGRTRKYSSLEETGEPFADEHTVMATTTALELSRFVENFGRWLDVSVQKECTNTKARATVYIDKVAILSDLPATALLNLESKLAEVRKVYAAIPTNDTTERWHRDEQLGCWVSEPRITYRSQKVMKSFVAYDATDKHPAQVKVYNEDIRVGTWETVIQSGAMSPVEKQARLGRIDALIRAVKAARQHANCADIIGMEISSVIFNYIDGD